MSDRLISIIDDDEAVRKAIKALLRSFGFQVETFASAEQFLAASAPARSRCIVTDIQMPGLSGIDLKQRLVSAGLETPVIMITARTESPLHQQALDSGAFCLLKKPFEAADLMACITRAIG
jgi:FixJ family two-component response regulator